MNYLSQPVDKTVCIGNTLSTINISLSTLDNVLFNLSNYASSNISTLYADVSGSRSTLYQLPNGIVNYDYIQNGNNANVAVSANGVVANITNIRDGQSGKLILAGSSTVGMSITGWGSHWLFAPNASAMTINTTSFSATNIVNYYANDGMLFGQMTTYNKYVPIP